MSKSLLKKELNLYNDELPVKYEKAKKQEMKFTNKSGLKKHKSKLKNEILAERVNREKATLKNKRIKSAIDDYWKNKQGDQTSNNLKFLSSLSSTKLSLDEAQKVFVHNDGKLSKNKTKRKTEDKIEESLFSDKDFEKFDEEYQL